MRTAPEPLSAGLSGCSDMEQMFHCPVCQELFSEPVTLGCGHHFCLSCIGAVWDEDGPFFCPECQELLPSKPSLEIDAELQDRVRAFGTVPCDQCLDSPSEAVRTCLTCDASLCRAHALLHQRRRALRQHTVVEVTRDPLALKCPEHKDELKLFCVQDRLPVCCLCVLVGAHKSHEAPQLQEASARFKSLLQSSMNQLLRRRTEAENTIKDLESLYAQTVRSAAEVRERISEKYSRIHVVLDGDERLMKQVVDAEEACVTEWLSVQRQKMEMEIQETERLKEATKALLEENDHLRFLKLITAQNLCDPLDPPPLAAVDPSLCAPQKLQTVERLVDDLATSLSQHFPRMWSYLTSPALDVNSAHPKLQISEDKRQVTWRQRPTDGDSSRPFDSQYSVLAEEGYTKGRRYWEVVVQDKPYWLIGVTAEPAPKHDAATTRPLGLDQSSWCLYHADGQYLACHDTQETPLDLDRRVRKLGVFADLHQGKLSFYDADAMLLIHRFTVHSQEPMFPMFNPCLDVNGLNKQPLTLFWIKEPWDWCDDYHDMEKVVEKEDKTYDDYHDMEKDVEKEDRRYDDYHDMEKVVKKEDKTYDDYHDMEKDVEKEDRRYDDYHDMEKVVEKEDKTYDDYHDMEKV